MDYCEDSLRHTKGVLLVKGLPPKAYGLNEAKRKVASKQAYGLNPEA